MQPPRNPRCVSRLAYCHPFQRGAVDLLMLPQLDLCLLLACSTPTRGRRNVILCQYNAPSHSFLVITLKYGTVGIWRLHFGAKALNYVSVLDDCAFEGHSFPMLIQANIQANMPYVVHPEYFSKAMSVSYVIDDIGIVYYLFYRHK